MSLGRCCICLGRMATRFVSDHHGAAHPACGACEWGRPCAAYFEQLPPRDERPPAGHRKRWRGFECECGQPHLHRCAYHDPILLFPAADGVVPDTERLLADARAGAAEARAIADAAAAAYESAQAAAAAADDGDHDDDEEAGRADPALPGDPDGVRRSADRSAFPPVLG